MSAVYFRQVGDKLWLLTMGGVVLCRDERWKEIFRSRPEVQGDGEVEQDL